MAVRDAKEFAVAFACAVTYSTEKADDFIAKNGDECLFELMNKAFPQVGVAHNFLRL
jgi:hypothetical protein